MMTDKDEPVQVHALPEGCELLTDFCDRFLLEIASQLGISYEQIAAEYRADPRWSAAREYFLDAKR